MSRQTFRGGETQRQFIQLKKNISFGSGWLPLLQLHSMWFWNNSNEFTKTLQTGQAQDCIKDQCDQCGHETTVTEHKWMNHKCWNHMYQCTQRDRKLAQKYLLSKHKILRSDINVISVILRLWKGLLHQNRPNMAITNTSATRVKTKQLMWGI